MRLWHVELIPYLADIHLIAQWRELCAIIKDIAETGTTHHVLINPIMEYDWLDFLLYSKKVVDELEKRGKNITKSYTIFMENLEKAKTYFPTKATENSIPYPYWHNDRYLKQCFYNLEEKADRGMITEKEWENIKTSTPIVMADWADYIPF